MSKKKTELHKYIDNVLHIIISEILLKNPTINKLPETDDYNAIYKHYKKLLKADLNKIKVITDLPKFCLDILEDIEYDACVGII